MKKILFVALFLSSYAFAIDEIPIINPQQNGTVSFKVNDAGTVKEVMNIGPTGITNTGVGYFNGIVNGNADINQRGSTSYSADAAHTLDRWNLRHNYTTVAVSRATSSPTPPTGSSAVFKMAVTTRGSGTYYVIAQAVGTDITNRFAGKKISVGLKAMRNSSFTAGNFRIGICQSTSVDGTAAELIGSGSNCANGTTTVNKLSSDLTTSTWTLLKNEGVTVAASTKTLVIYVGYSNVDGNPPDGSEIYFSQVMLNEGSLSQPYTNHGLSPLNDALACYKYYYCAIAAGVGNLYAYAGTGVAKGADTATVNVILPITMRTTPTLSAGGTFYLTKSNADAATAAVSSILVRTYADSPMMVGLDIQKGSGDALTAGNTTFLVRGNNTTASLCFTAEP